MKSLLFHIVRLLDICFVSNLYLFLGVVISSFISKYIIRPYYHNLSKLENLLILIFNISLISIAVFFIRQLIKHKMPNPFNGIAGFKHTYLRELNGNIVMAFAFLIYLKPDITTYIDPLYNIF